MRPVIFVGCFLWIVIGCSKHADDAKPLSLEERQANAKKSAPSQSDKNRAASRKPPKEIQEKFAKQREAELKSQIPEKIYDQAIVTRSPGQVQVLCPVYTIDQLYQSMTGPWSDQKVNLVDSDVPELVWITGAEVEMVGADGETPSEPQFMCHTNLDIDSDAHNATWNRNLPLDGRLFTLSQGQLSVFFPEGFGIPVRSDEALDLVTQVLNLNVKTHSFEVRHKVTLHFVKDSDRQRRMTPLFESGVSGMISLEDRSLVYDIAEELEGEACKSCCLPGHKASHWDEKQDSHGRRFTGHWIVKPGRQVNRTRVTSLMGLPFDTKVHYIAVHLHPFAESLELRDLTTDEVIFKSHARNLKEKIGLEHVDAFSSEEGVMLHRDHEYELVSVYHNTTNVDQDSMAVMYLYLHDRGFPQQPVVAQRPILNSVK